MSAVGGVIALVALGIAVAAFVRTTRTQARVLDLCRVRRLEVVNDQGTVVLSAFPGSQGGILSMGNTQGAVLVGLSAEERGGYIAAFNANGEILSDLGVDETGNQRIIAMTKLHAPVAFSSNGRAA